MGTYRPDQGKPDATEPNGIAASLSLRAEDSSSDAVFGVDVGINAERVLRDRLLAAVSRDRVDRMSERELRGELLGLADELSQAKSGAPDYHEQGILVNQVLEELRGYGPLGALMRESEISEILINGPHQVFIERRGQLQLTEVAFRDEDHLLHVIRRMIATSGRRLTPESPMADARLPDGSRLNAVLNPPALNGPLVSIRRFGVRPLTADDLLANGSLAKEMLDFLAACVKGRLNTIVSGGSGSGKTTLLNALSRYVPSSERLVTVEDTAELELQQPHVAKMEAQPRDLKGEGEVTMRDLVRNALRMRPDRIIVGECRGSEAFEMLQAMNTGHDGSMTTIHANSTREALARVEMMVSQVGLEIPIRVIRSLIQSSINLVVQVARMPDGKRKVIAISEIVGSEGDTISMHDLFTYVQTGMDLKQGSQGYFRSTGIRPQCLNKLAVSGGSLPPDLFVERRLQVPRGRGPGP
jgi:pilus assembly protein CpaF